VYVRVKKGKDAANRSVQQLQRIPGAILRGFSRRKISINEIGPLWMGQLGKRSVISEVRSAIFKKQLKRKHEVWNLVQLLEEEADAPAFFYSMEDVAGHLKVLLPKRESLFDMVRENGFVVSRTHCTPIGFKTNATLDEIEHIFKKLAKK